MEVQSGRGARGAAGRQCCAVGSAPAPCTASGDTAATTLQEEVSVIAMICFCL